MARNNNHPPETLPPPPSDSAGSGLGLSRNPPGPGADDGVELSEAEAQEYADTLDEKLKGWVEAQRYENTQCTTTLYKFDNPTTGEDKSQCGQWVDDIPDSHTIGLTYGPGRYLLLVTLPRTKAGPRAIKGYRFRIHPFYDELRRRATYDGQYPSLSLLGPRPHAPGAPASLPAPGGMDAMTAGLSMVREVLNIVSPLLKQRDNAPGLDMGSMMMRNYGMMNDVMRRNLIESQALIADGIRAKIEGSGDMEGMQGAGEGEGEEKEPSLIEQITPLLNQFVPLILGRGPGAVVATQAVQALPQFQKVTRDKGEFVKIVNHLDKAIGKEKVDGLLKRLKLERPPKQEGEKVNIKAG